MAALAKALHRRTPKGDAPLLVNPIDELYRIINEARERDAEYERQLISPM
jgi:hypothetical protein